MVVVNDASKQWMAVLGTAGGGGSYRYRFLVANINSVQ